VSARQQGRGVLHVLFHYNEPEIALDLLRILDHNEIPYVLVDQVCCGMPHMESGALDEWRDRRSTTCRAWPR